MDMGAQTQRLEPGPPDRVVALVASSGFVEGAQVAAALEASREKLAMGGGGVASHAPACDAL